MVLPWAPGAGAPGFWHAARARSSDSAGTRREQRMAIDALLKVGTAPRALIDCWACEGQVTALVLPEGAWTASPVGLAFRRGPLAPRSRLRRLSSLAPREARAARQHRTHGDSQTSVAHSGA